jgi:hypothetical protein
MTISAPGSVIDAHLIALIRELTGAVEREQAEDAHVTQVAWQLLTELTEVTYARDGLEHELALAVRAAQATVIDERTGTKNSLRHIRGYLKERGKLPRRGTSSLVTLAWLGEPEQSRRRGFYVPALRSLVNSPGRFTWPRKAPRAGQPGSGPARGRTI